MSFIDLPAHREHLMQWYMRWLNEYENSKYFAKDASSSQVHFVRDRLAPMIRPKVLYEEWEDIKIIGKDGEMRDVKRNAWVVGEHTSKSVRLPVYAFERQDLGLRLMMRDNHYNWKLSVQSEQPINCGILFTRLFITEPPSEPEYTGDHLRSVYFEGFPPEWCFGYYGQNRQQWSAEIHSDNTLWTTIFLIMSELGDLRYLKYNTKVEHRAQLERQTEARKEQDKRRGV